MPPATTLLDYLTTSDIVVFLGVPLALLTIVLAQQILAARATARIAGSSARRPPQPSITKDPGAWPRRDNERLTR